VRIHILHHKKKKKLTQLCWETAGKTVQSTSNQLEATSAASAGFNRKTGRATKKKTKKTKLDPSCVGE